MSSPRPPTPASPSRTPSPARSSRRPASVLFRRILTYRLALYYLAAILIAALGLAALGIVHQPVLSLAFSAMVSLCVCLGVNRAFAHVFGARTNSESVAISAIIITLIITPAAPGDLQGAGFLALVCAWAMA